MPSLNLSRSEPQSPDNSSNTAADSLAASATLISNKSDANISIKKKKEDKDEKEKKAKSPAEKEKDHKEKDKEHKEKDKDHKERDKEHKDKELKDKKHKDKEHKKKLDSEFDEGPAAPTYIPKPPPPEEVLSEQISTKTKSFTVYLPEEDSVNTIIFKPERQVKSVLSDFCTKRGIRLTDYVVADAHGGQVDLDWTLDKVEGAGITLSKPKRHINIMFSHDDSQYSVPFSPERTLFEVAEEICKSRGLQPTDFIIKDESGQQLSGSSTLSNLSVDTVVLMKKKS